jgi:hypothetical protein
MGSWADNEWNIGAKGRLFHRLYGTPPDDDTLLGFVKHQHHPNTGWSDLTGGSEQPLDIGHVGGEGSIFTLKGHKCLVSIRFTRNAVDEEVILSGANGWSSSIIAGTGELILGFTLTGV